MATSMLSQPILLFLSARRTLTAFVLGGVLCLKRLERLRLLSMLCWLSPWTTSAASFEGSFLICPGRDRRLRSSSTGWDRNSGILSAAASVSLESAGVSCVSLPSSTGTCGSERVSSTMFVSLGVETAKETCLDFLSSGCTSAVEGRVACLEATRLSGARSPSSDSSSSSGWRYRRMCRVAQTCGAKCMLFAWPIRGGRLLSVVTLEMDLEAKKGFWPGSSTNMSSRMSCISRRSSSQTLS
mmetsp:Transcript_20757/g.48539  ORF Transcript_20757/g.48539 Transcript_20757/m.48539 type:complete len:241 (+) Transcript_20757:1458-2180(+)